MKLDIRTKKRPGHSRQVSKITITGECIGDEVLLAIIARRLDDASASHGPFKALREAFNIDLGAIRGHLLAAAETKEPAHAPD